MIGQNIIILWHKILCKLNKHDYVNDNAGISARFTMNGMDYYHCRYCPRFIVRHPRPTPKSYVKLVLKEKMLFERKLKEKVVLTEKYDPRKDPSLPSGQLFYMDFRYAR